MLVELHTAWLPWLLPFAFAGGVVSLIAGLTAALATVGTATAGAAAATAATVGTAAAGVGTAAAGIGTAAGVGGTLGAVGSTIAAASPFVTAASAVANTIKGGLDGGWEGAAMGLGKSLASAGAGAALGPVVDGALGAAAPVVDGATSAAGDALAPAIEAGIGDAAAPLMDAIGPVPGAGLDVAGLGISPPALEAAFFGGGQAAAPGAASVGAGAAPGTAGVMPAAPPAISQPQLNEISQAGSSAGAKGGGLVGGSVGGVPGAIQGATVGAPIGSAESLTQATKLAGSGMDTAGISAAVQPPSLAAGADRAATELGIGGPMAKELDAMLPPSLQGGMSPVGEFGQSAMAPDPSFGTQDIGMPGTGPGGGLAPTSILDGLGDGFRKLNTSMGVLNKTAGLGQTIAGMGNPPPAPKLTPPPIGVPRRVQPLPIPGAPIGFPSRPGLGMPFRPLSSLGGM